MPAGEAATFRQRVNVLTTAQAQLDCVRDSLDAWAMAGQQEDNHTREDWKLAA